MIRRLSLMAGVALILLGGCANSLYAQALYTATGPGKYISVGVAGSVFESDYGHHRLIGGTAFLDANLTRRMGLEVEARSMRFHQGEDVHFSTFLGGIRISSRARQVRPYAKLLAGRGHFSFPFGDAQGSYVVVAPGAGLDWRVHESGKLNIRVVDIEFQQWPQFTFGALHPYGISSGFSYRIF